ncbi:hypothetical protein [Hyperthermus butylicus]|uniref:Uncharacterized protein n=1 Tax=Hyperthermus butylicus (strain DSM 5456 / JCM 9403 / PLM1-5) TaxID=415426 RepID=A2BK37_HYPBU|nr:hypothetical protein [Hyperthermus butylicus]ABM80348.1 hypothetical protein Hbut_0486 [Hyperthermus butylicus DSM 5456]
MAPKLPLERRAVRLQAANKVLLPLLSGVKRFSRLWRAYNPLLAGVSRVDQTRDYTVTILTVHLPASNPLVVALYTSAQESRPITPSQLGQRIARLRAQLAKLRGRVFNAADIVYAILAPRGFTSGAIKLARRLGVNTARKPEEVIQILAKYLTTRLNRLYLRLKGKLIWGELPLLIYALQELAAALGTKHRVIEPAQALQLAEKGGFLT